MPTRQGGFIDGAWTESPGSAVINVINPYTEEIIGGVRAMDQDAVDVAADHPDKQVVFFAVGTAIASRLVARLITDKRRAWGVTLGFGGCALTCVAISGVGHFSVYLILATVLGLANAVGNGALGPLFLLRVADAQRGRVMAALNGVMSAGSIAATILGGALGTALSPRLVFLVSGAAGLLVAIVMGLVILPPLHRPDPKPLPPTEGGPS